jgi:hypothetical protein
VTTMTTYLNTCLWTSSSQACVGRNPEENLHIKENSTWKTFYRVPIKDENMWHYSKRTAPWSNSLFIVSR